MQDRSQEDAPRRDHTHCFWSGLRTQRPLGSRAGPQQPSSPSPCPPCTVTHHLALECTLRWNTRATWSLCSPRWCSPQHPRLHGARRPARGPSLTGTSLRSPDGNCNPCCASVSADCLCLDSPGPTGHSSGLLFPDAMPVSASPHEPCRPRRDAVLGTHRRRCCSPRGSW